MKGNDDDWFVWMFVLIFAVAIFGYAPARLFGYQPDSVDETVDTILIAISAVADLTIIGAVIAGISRR